MAGNANSGNRKQKVRSGSRKWLREICDDPTRRQKVQEILDHQLEAGDLEGWWKAYEHGFGRPPQSLDVSVHRTDRFALAFGDDSLSSTALLPEASPHEPSN